MSVTPQGHEHRGSGDVPVDLELEEPEARRLVEARISSLAAHEKEGPPPVPEPLILPFEGLLQDGWGSSEGP